MGISWENLHVDIGAERARALCQNDVHSPHYYSHTCGSLYVSEKLPTHHFPKPTFCPK